MDNVRAVLGWALERDPELGLRLAGSLEAYWVVRDPVEGSAWLERFVAGAPGAEPKLRAAGLRALGGTADILGDNERAAPCYREALELFTAAGADAEAAHLRFRIAANMVMRGGHAAEAWPMLEESLREAREIGLRVGESQALGFLVSRAHRSGDLETAIALALESAEIAREVAWTWWEAGQVLSVAGLERERGDLDAAEEYAVRALGLAVELRDRRLLVFSEAELAVIAAARGDAARAGRLWGAVEAEASLGRVGQWDRERGNLEALVLSVDGPEFALARSEGAMLTITQAADLDPVAGG
jgi:tetratricopeptide (TPR) repeat protein